MSFFKPRLLPLCASFFGTYAISAVYASINSDANTGTYQAFKNSALGFFFSSFDSLVKKRKDIFYKAFWGAYQTSGLLAFCAWHETGSKFAFLWGAMTLVHQARWAYNASVSKSIFDIGGEQPHPPTDNPPPYSPQAPTAAASAPPIDATLSANPPTANYGAYSDPNNVASYPSLIGGTAGGDYDAFTRTSANSVGSEIYR